MHLPGGSPRSAGLPMTRNMPYSSASVPNKSRNLTGIYLGLEGNSRPPRSKSAIPPLARGRGMSFKVRTPSEDRRYKMVEGLRIKEEKRGFTGSTLRTCRSAHPSSTSTYETMQYQPVSGRRRWGPGKRIDPSNIDDLIRPNPRNFTTVSNSGVTRSERLVGWMPFLQDPYLATPPDHISTEVAEEVHKIASSNEELAGLEECYKRICKGNMETLYSLLPNRKAQQHHSMRRDNIGFTVRSYRNPARAEILAEFPDPLNPQGRPRTVPIQRPLVPSPYFFRHQHPPPNTAGRAGLSHRQHGEPGQFDDASDYLVVPRILAAPGAGGISETLQCRTSPLLSSLQLITGKEYMSQFPATTRSADDLPDPVPQPLAQPSLSDIAGEAKEAEPQKLDGQEGKAEEQTVGGKGEGDLQKPSEDTQTVPSAKIAEEHSEESTNVTVDSEQKSDKKEDGPKTSKETAQEDSNKEEPAVVEAAERKDGDDDSEYQAKKTEADEMENTAPVLIADDVVSPSEDDRPRPRLKTSNSGADIMLGLETDDGKTAEVEIDSLESDELQPEEIPKGRVRKASIVDKLSKSKESEMIALSIMESAGQRQREFEQLINEHQELVQEISRTPSAENIVQSETGRDP